MAAAVDAGYLSGYLGISPPVITECLATPTADLVRSLLEAVTNKAREHEELIADKLQVDTELEEAIRSTETRSQALKAQSEKASKELEELRQRLAAEGTSSILVVKLDTS
jgi:nucleoprotein TPR